MADNTFFKLENRRSKVRTDFWIQNSRIFPHFFSKTKVSFSRLEVIEYGINTDLKNVGTKFFHDDHELQTCGRDWIRRICPKRKTWNFHLQSTWYKLKKKKSTFYHFFNLYYPDFLHVWKTAGQISKLFQEFKTMDEPWRSLVKFWLYDLRFYPFTFPLYFSQHLCVLNIFTSCQCLMK